MRPEIRIEIVKKHPSSIDFGVVESGVRATDIVSGKFAESFNQCSFHLNRAKAIELLDECLKND